ncbi:hypothetical protein HK097_011574, partial [Rhizophlyctis rosea]
MFSYSWANKDKVLQTKTELEKRGYSVWLDEQRMARIGNIYEGMYDGLNNSKIVCSFLSVHYETSANCKRELCFASDRKKPIVPVRLDSGPFTWSHVITAGALYVNMSDAYADWNEKINELVANVEAALNRLNQQLSPQPPIAQQQQNVVSPAVVASVTPPVMSNTELQTLLKPANITKMANDVDEVFRKRLPGTRDWLLADVKEWADDVKSSSVFWLVASAGAGKSVVAASVIRELEAASTLGAYFVSKADQADRNDASCLVRTIAYQLALKFPAAARHINELEKQEAGFLATANPSLLFQKLIIGLLEKLEAEMGDRNLIIVLDALDECGTPGSRDRGDFLSALGNAVLPRKVKLLVTSRPEVDIRQELKKFDPYMIELNEERSMADLFLFAESRVTAKFYRATKDDNLQRARRL